MLNNSPRDNDIAQLKREVRARIIAQRDALAPAFAPANRAQFAPIL